MMVEPRSDADGSLAVETSLRGLSAPQLVADKQNARLKPHLSEPNLRRSRIVLLPFCRCSLRGSLRRRPQHGSSHPNLLGTCGGASNTSSQCETWLFNKLGSRSAAPSGSVYLLSHSNQPGWSPVIVRGVRRPFSPSAICRPPLAWVGVIGFGGGSWSSAWRRQPLPPPLRFH